jgi:c-di-GMP-binding flagellar brake protein YcgR
MSSSTSQFDPANRDLEPYTVHSRVEILFLLRTMQKRKLLVNLDLPDSRCIIVTSVLAVDEKTNTVILDSARGDALNHELMSARDVEFTTQLDGVSISFHTGPIASCEYEKLPAVRIALPRSLIRLQRREHFRVPLPIANPVKCLVPLDVGAQPVATHIVDIGGGGVAIVEDSGRLSYAPGMILSDCRLLLPDLNTVVTSLEIRNLEELRLHNGMTRIRLGCKFIELPNDMAALLQRYVMEIERARLSR